MLALLLTGNNQGIDDSIRFWLYDHRIPAVTAFAAFISFLVKPTETIIFILILLIIPMTRKNYGVPVAAGAIAITIVNNLIKHIVCRPRPDEVFRLVTEHGYSFPSGHAITSMFIYSLLIYLLVKHAENRRVRTVLVILCTVMLVFVGPSRAYLGVHYPTDVLAGWGLALVALCIEIMILEYIEKRGKINGSN